MTHLWFTFSVFAVILSLQLTYSKTHRSRHRRVIGGTSVPRSKYKFMTHLIGVILPPGIKPPVSPKNESLWGNLVRNDCSATIISSRHVLTSFHCIFSVMRNPNAGITYLRKFDEWVIIVPSTSTTFVATTFYGAPYNPYSRYADMAIVELSAGDEFPPENAPIDLAVDFTKTEGKVIVLGYGHNEAVRDASSPPPNNPVLRQVVLSLKNSTFCTQYGERRGLDNRDALCIGDNGKGISVGDSGGPTLYIGRDDVLYQVGVNCITTSGRNSLDRFASPDVVRAVSPHCLWIELMTDGEAMCVTSKPLPTIQDEQIMNRAIVAPVFISPLFLMPLFVF